MGLVMMKQLINLNNIKKLWHGQGPAILLWQNSLLIISEYFTSIQIYLNPNLNYVGIYTFYLNFALRK